MAKMNLLFLALTAVVAVSVEAMPTSSESFMHSLELGESGDYTVFWKFDDKSITFEVHVKTTGWVGFGISPNGGMAGADLVIGWVDKDGKAFLKDRHATGESMPIIDTRQDWFLDSGREQDGFTILKFHRALDTKDCEHDRAITLDTLKVIWSFRNQDPAHDNDISYHGTNRGTKSVNLLEPTPNREHSDLASAVSFTVTNPGIIVPHNERTVYYCQVFRMPNVTEKHHIIKFAPVIQKENTAIVHHIVAYACFNPDPDKYIGLSAPCFDGAMPAELGQCRYPFAVWAVGGGDFYFPDDVGFGIGGTNDPTLLIMEIHFDNPEKKAGIIDNSGMTLWYTPKLRPNEAGTFIFGNEVTPQMVLPPGVPKFTITGVCHSECTSKAIPAGGVHVFGTLLHAHLAGREIRIRQFRGDEQVGDFGRDNQYDFNYQQIRLFNPTRTLLPGDSVITECHYDTSARRELTFGGLATTEEMCVGWVLYYPKVDLGFCSSDVSRFDQLKAVNIVPTSDNPDYEEFIHAMSNVTWTSAKIAAHQSAQTESDLRYSCASAETKQDVGKVQATKFPADLKFAADPQAECDAITSAATGSKVAFFTIWMSLLTFTAAVFK